MDREEIIRMAREAGFDPHDMSDDFTCNLIDIERFAKLVAAAEREAIMEICNRHTEPIAGVIHHAIRARGNT